MDTYDSHETLEDTEDAEDEETADSEEQPETGEEPEEVTEPQEEQEDVYKRQVPQRAQPLSLVTTQEDSNETAVDKTEAVSYTHLDVYKRQIWLRGNTARCLWKIATRISAIIIPIVRCAICGCSVSYTHLIENWDTYVAKVKEMGIENVIGIYQEALDAWNR